MPRCRLSAVQQRIELARVVERIEIVAAADMGRADEDLRHGGAAVGALRSSCARSSRSRATSISVKATLFFSEAPWLEAIGAIRRGVDFDWRPWSICAVGLRDDSQFIWGCAPRRQPARTPHVDAAGAGPQQRPRAGVRGGAGGQHVVDQHQAAARRPRPCARRHAGTRPAHSARARHCDSPTCCAVALTRLSAASATGTPLSCAIALAQQRRLVEAARPQPPPVQRHRHQRVGVRQQLAPGARHPAAHDRARGRAGRRISARAPARGRRRRSARRRGRGGRRAGRRSPASTARRGRDRRRTECRAARNRAAR